MWKDLKERGRDLVRPCLSVYTLLHFFILLLLLAFAGLSHQSPDFPWVQPLRGRHGQLSVELQNVSSRYGSTDGWGAAPQEQRPTVLDKLWPCPPPCFHELRCPLSPAGECKTPRDCLSVASFSPQAVKRFVCVTLWKTHSKACAYFLKLQETLGLSAGSQFEQFG